ncbi:hypothetical protein ACIA6D_41420 [Streptomyces cacaoi]
MLDQDARVGMLGQQVESPHLELFQPVSEQATGARRVAVLRRYYVKVLDGEKVRINALIERGLGGHEG